MRIGSAVIDGEQRIVADAGEGAFAAPDGTRMADVIAGWDSWRPQLEGLAGGGGTALDPEQLQWLPPLVPDKLICIGTNYHDHVAEMEAAGGPTAPPSPWPFAFLKPPRTTLVGHNATVTLPGYARKVDWEAELAVVIGDGAKANGSDPLDAVFGYSVLNDLSVRDYIPLPHALGLDALVCKGWDGSAPMGPWIVPAEEIGDPRAVTVRLSVNGMLKQDSTTAQMIFGVREIVAHLGRVLTLVAGDVIATGTPGGVGDSRTPPRYLRDGDTVEVFVSGVGTLSNPVVSEPNR